MGQAVIDCASLDQVREQIDRVDEEIVRLLGERSGFVRQAVRFKRSADEARAPARVEQVVARVRGLAGNAGADPELVEQVYRAMIAWFVADELSRLDGST